MVPPLEDEHEQSRGRGVTMEHDEQVILVGEREQEVLQVVPLDDDTIW
jgi:hypothetical protein